MKLFLGCLLGSALLASCSAPKPAEAPTTTAQSLDQLFIGAWNAKNTVQLDSLLADDVQYAQGETRFNGKSEVSDKWVRATLGTISDLRTYSTTSGADANIVYEAGTFSTDVLPAAPSQPHGEGRGNFLLLWKKNNKNAWKLSYVQLEGLPVRAKN